MRHVPDSLIERAQATLDAFAPPAGRRRPAPQRDAVAEPPATGREAFDRLFAPAPAPPPSSSQFSN